jgi:hypothetical protein
MRRIGLAVVLSFGLLAARHAQAQSSTLPLVAILDAGFASTATAPLRY